MAETSVQMAVLAGTQRTTLYQLQYDGVEALSIHTKNDLFPLDHSRFGDCGYDELLAEGQHYFRHNILFQTGTEISITFQQFRFKTRRATADILKRYAGLR